VVAVQWTAGGGSGSSSGCCGGSSSSCGCGCSCRQRLCRRAHEVEILAEFSSVIACAVTLDFYGIIDVDNLAEAVVAAGIRLAHLHFDVVEVDWVFVDSLRTREVVVVVVVFLSWFLFESGVRLGE